MHLCKQRHQREDERNANLEISNEKQLMDSSERVDRRLINSCSLMFSFCSNSISLNININHRNKQMTGDKGDVCKEW